MQLELGLKEQVRAAAPKPLGPLKSDSVQLDTAKAEAFSHHPRIERSCSNSRQWLLVQSAKSFGRRRSRSPYDARPSLSATAGAAVTRNVESLSDL
jgi:hypothetical protein